MKFIVPKIVLILLATVLLSSCTKVAIKETWRNPDAPATRYQKLLIVGVANDSNLRILFEDIQVETLRRQGVPATASHTLLPSLKNADRPQIQETAHEAGADGVVITRGISKSERTNYQYTTGTLQQRTVVIQESGPDSSKTVVMSAIGIAPHETDFELATLQSNFFDAASATLLWSARGNISETGRRAEACWKYSDLLVKALQKDQLIGSR